MVDGRVRKKENGKKEKNISKTITHRKEQKIRL
jgi:hypothetical protein